MKIKYLFSFLAFSLLLSFNAFAQQSFTARVIDIIDGDTITIFTQDNRQLKIRFAGIDAPESDQEFGNIVKEHLLGAILNQTVTVSEMKNDCRDRLSATVHHKERNLNLLLVDVGDAWADPDCVPDQKFVTAEKTAREKKIGLWQNPNPIKPSDFLKARQTIVQPPKTEKERKIFSGLEPIRTVALNVYIGMTLDSFEELCKTTGNQDAATTDTGHHAFATNVTAASEELLKKGCNGRFIFERTARRRPYLLIKIQD